MSRMLGKAAGAAVIGIVLSMSGAGTAYADPAQYPCLQWHFCGWDETGPFPATMLIDQSGTISCGQKYDLVPGVRNRLGSINNKTSGYWFLYDGDTRAFIAEPGSYGNLPVSSQNNVDNMQFVCG